MTALPQRRAFAAAAPLAYSRAHRSQEAAIREHLPLVRRLAWHVHGSMSTLVEVEDLVQVGLVALVEAVAAFEERGPSENRAAALRQYLVTRLKGAMIDELRRQATATRGAMQRRKRYREAVAALTARLGHAPEDAVVARHLGVGLDALRRDYATAEALRFESIDAVYADDSPWFADAAPDAFAQLAEAGQRDALVAAIAALPEREAQVVQLYYVDELNLEEIGQVFGIGAARVCQIKASAHARLKKALAGRG